MKYAVGEKVGISIKTMIVDGTDVDYLREWYNGNQKDNT